METTTGGVRGVSLPCWCGCVAKLPLQVPQGSLTSATFRKQLRTLGLKELCTQQGMTEGDALAGDTTSNEAAALRRVPKVRVGNLVAERVQVGASKFTNGVSESLVKIGCSSLVAFRRVGTQRNTRHAEAGRGDRRVLSR
eukprot:3410841-Pleurochrysis_carterae.AAC.1